MTRLAKFWHDFIAFFTMPEPKPPVPVRPIDDPLGGSASGRKLNQLQGAVRTFLQSPETAEKVIKYRKPRRRVKSKPKPPTRKR